MLEALSPVTLQNYSLTLWSIKSCDIHLVRTMCFLRVIVLSFRIGFGSWVLGQFCLLFIMHSRCWQVSRCHYTLAATLMGWNLIFLVLPFTWQEFSKYHFQFIFVFIPALMLHCPTNAANTRLFLVWNCYVTLWPLQSLSHRSFLFLGLWPPLCPSLFVARPSLLCSRLGTISP